MICSIYVWTIILYIEITIRAWIFKVGTLCVVLDVLEKVRKTVLLLFNVKLLFENQLTIFFKESSVFFVTDSQVLSDTSKSIS